MLSSVSTHDAAELDTYDFERLSKSLFFWGGFVVRVVPRRLFGQAVIMVGAFDGSVRLVQDFLRLLDKRLDLLYKLVLVAVLLLARFHVLDVLHAASVPGVVKI